MCENVYLSALRSSTTSTWDVIDDWWLIVDLPPLADRLPEIKPKKYELEIHGIILII